jgi:hypothetical protein
MQDCIITAAYRRRSPIAGSKDGLFGSVTSRAFRNALRGLKALIMRSA